MRANLNSKAKQTFIAPVNSLAWHNTVGKHRSKGAMSPMFTNEHELIKSKLLITTLAQARLGNAHSLLSPARRLDCVPLQWTFSPQLFPYPTSVDSLMCVLVCDWRNFVKFCNL